MNAKVLLIETDRPLAMNLIDYLKSHDFEVQWHVDPQTAMTSVDEMKPDLIILDMIMAGRSGTEFLYELRSYGDLQDLPVIIYSSISSRELGQSDLLLPQLNISDYIYKPESSFTNLLKTIYKTLLTTKSKSHLTKV